VPVPGCQFEEFFLYTTLPDKFPASVDDSSTLYDLEHYCTSSNRFRAIEEPVYKRFIQWSDNVYAGPLTYNPETGEWSSDVSEKHPITVYYIIRENQETVNKILRFEGAAAVSSKIDKYLMFVFVNTEDLRNYLNEIIQAYNNLQNARNNVVRNIVVILKGVGKWLAELLDLSEEDGIPPKILYASAKYTPTYLKNYVSENWDLIPDIWKDDLAFAKSLPDIGSEYTFVVAQYCKIEITLREFTEDDIDDYIDESQYPEVTRVYIDGSEDSYIEYRRYVAGKVVEFGNIKCNSYVEAEIVQQKVRDTVIQLRAKAIIKSRFRFSLNSEVVCDLDVYTTPAFEVTVEFPYCSAFYYVWYAADEDASQLPSGPEFDLDLPDADLDFSIPVYTCSIEGKTSYSWRCDEKAEFEVVVKYGDVKLSPSRYTIKNVELLNENENESENISYTINQSKSKIIFDIPHKDTSVSFKVKIVINSSDNNDIELEGYGYFYVSEWLDRILTCEVITDKQYYDYGSTNPASVLVRVRTVKGQPVTGLKISDNWNSTYIDKGDGLYEGNINISSLPVGTYSVYVKIDTNNQCYKNNLSDEEYTEIFYYNPVTYENQEFKLTYPLIENLEVYVNDKKTSKYTFSINQYGEGILKITQSLNENDVVKVKYKAYATSVSFNIGRSEPVSCTRVDEKSITKFGKTQILRIRIPFISSPEEACEIAQTYLEYFAKPSKIIMTSNKWDGD